MEEEEEKEEVEEGGGGGRVGGGRGGGGRRGRRRRKRRVRRRIGGITFIPVEYTCFVPIVDIQSDNEEPVQSDVIFKYPMEFKLISRPPIPAWTTCLRFCLLSKATADQTDEDIGQPTM